MSVFLGLDLAWTAYRETGICAFDDKARVHALETRVATAEEFADLACSFGDDVVVGVDAPLVVTSGRSAERAVARAFARFRASPHQANLALLQATDRMAGPGLHAALTARGFRCDPNSLTPRARGRHVMEVYPHAAHVRLFDLRERLPYKRKKGRSVAFVRTQLCLYQEHLGSLLGRELPALLEDAAIQALLAPAAVDCRGLHLKRLEDMLDALTCAWVAWHTWQRGSSGIEVFGDEHGHVVVPRVDRATSAPAPTSPSGPVFAPAIPSLRAPAEALPG